MLLYGGKKIIWWLIKWNQIECGYLDDIFSLKNQQLTKYTVEFKYKLITVLF